MTETKDHNIIKWSVLLIISRSILLIIFQGVFASWYHISGNPTPCESAAKWWTVYGTGVDICCLALMAFALEKEGKTIHSLIDFDIKNVLQDMKHGLFIFLLIFPLLGLLLSMGAGYFLFNEKTLSLISGQLAQRVLPDWAYYYSILIWWIIWSFTEELTYQKFGLDKLTNVFDQKKVILFIAFFWAL
jgi:membrane protease YdiL (CAAX protease family)